MGKGIKADRKWLSLRIVGFWGKKGESRELPSFPRVATLPIGRPGKTALRFGSHVNSSRAVFPGRLRRTGKEARPPFMFTLLLIANLPIRPILRLPSRLLKLSTFKNLTLVGWRKTA